MAFTEFERDAAAEIGVRWKEFITAVGVMVYTNEGEETKPTIASIALAFNTTVELVREAVAEHYCLISHHDDDPTKQTVESDGE